MKIFYFHKIASTLTFILALDAWKLNLNKKDDLLFKLSRKSGIAVLTAMIQLCPSTAFYGPQIASADLMFNIGNNFDNQGTDAEVLRIFQKGLIWHRMSSIFI
jgi:hypothetical protein